MTKLISIIVSVLFLLIACSENAKDQGISDTLDIKYNDLGRIEVDEEGQITKQADLFFLGVEQMLINQDQRLLYLGNSISLSRKL